MESANITINEEWIRKKLNITHDNLEDIKTLSLAGTYQEKISHLGNSLQKFTRLKELDLSRNSLVSLEGLENCKYLEKLNLYYNNIYSLKEIERLKYNPVLSELDLRLNPITKEENDYRLYLIQLLPSLKLCDDRAIRDSERQMAIAYFEQNNNSNQTATGGGSSGSNEQAKQGYEQFQPSSAVLSRIKSVTNIAKRSAGISESEHCEDEKANFQTFIRGHDNYASQRHYEPEDEHDAYNNNQLDAKESNINRSKSFSMQNLRALNQDNTYHQSNYISINVFFYFK